VRQLNKYDFHKIRANSGDASSIYGDNAWEFKHPDFQLHNKDQIDNIKRKTTSSRKHGVSNGANSSVGASVNALTNDGTFSDNHGEFASVQYVARLEHELSDSRAAQDTLHKELAALRDVQSTTLHRLNTLQQDHKVTDDVLRQLLMLLQSAQFRNPMESPTASNTYSQLLNLLTTLNTTEATRNDIPVAAAPRANVLPPLAGAKPSPNYTTASLGKPANSTYLVLLVEDDELSVRVCRKFLAQYGCQVDVANDGVSAVKRAQAGSYDIILMETVMPQLDGLSATDLIRKFDPGTPIVAMTSNMPDETDDVAKYYRHGITDILPKPFSKDELTQLLDLYLKRDATAGANNGAMVTGPEADDEDKRPLLPPPSSAFQNDPQQPPGEPMGGYKRSDDEIIYGSVKKPRLV
jgi:osomolarity two-component system response regulator SKN7